MYTITRKQIKITFFSYLVLFAVLSIFKINNFEILNIVGGIFLFIVPGLLTLFLFKLEYLNIWTKIVFSVLFSVFELMVLGLIGNFLLHAVSINKPLASEWMLFLFLISVTVLFKFSFKHIKGFKFSFKKYIFFDKFQDAVFVLISMFLMVLSIYGAIALNNGGTSTTTMTMLFLMAIYIFFLAKYNKKIGQGAILTSIFFMSLALLFMTSLRGFYVTGHDIQREFFVFQLAKDLGYWNMSIYKDAYNACLSITILPTIISNMLAFSDFYIYKILYQVLFALVPVIVYLISINWATKIISLLSSIFFISFPTFFQDMPFLIRQEVAFLFFGGMLLVLFNKYIDLKIRRILFVVFGTGVILAHYSTTYVILFVFGLTVAFIPIFRWVIDKSKEKGLLKVTSFDVIYDKKYFERRKINILMVSVLLGLSVVWTSGITNTDGHLKDVIGEMVGAIKNGFGGERSVDALSFFTFKTPDTEADFEGYIKNKVYDVRKNSSDKYFDDTKVLMYRNIKPVKMFRLPKTELGSNVSVFGYELSDISSFVGSLFVKLFEVSVFVGLAYVVFRRKLVGSMDSEYYTLAIFSGVFVGMNIVLPVLSVEYGVFRSLLQALFVLSPFIVIGLFFTGSFAKYFYLVIKRYILHGSEMITPSFSFDNRVPIFFSVIFFLYSTSFMAQAMGNNYPRIHLNNVGDDYDHFLITKDEEDAILWLKERTKENIGNFPLIQADRYGQKKLQSVIRTDVSGSIYPGIIMKDSYVFLTSANTLERKAVVSYDGSIITYTYPIEFLENNKNLVYQNDTVRIYK